MTTNHAILIKLKSHLNLNKSRLKVLTGLIIGVIGIRDVNLVKLACYQESDATDESQYRKLQRFFKLWCFSWEEVAKLTLSKIPKPRQGYVLSMDRTNWKFGKRHINILTVGIVVGKVSIPLVWTTLAQTTKRGNSNTHQRIALMKKVLKVLAVEDIYALTMDREFNGYQWLKWLNNKKTTWVLRLRKDTHINGKSAKFYSSTRKDKHAKKKSVFGLPLYFGCKSIKKGRADFLYVVSNNLTPNDALETYKKRWSIEVLFGHLKKKGFNFENTHMSDKKKIDKLMAVLTLAFLFTIGWGILLKEQNLLNAHQKRKSTFRLALDLIQSMFRKPNKHKEKIELFHQWVASDLNPQIFVV